MRTETIQLDWKEPAPKRLHDIVGNECAKRAVEVALAGSHEVVFLATVRAPASDFLKAAAQVARENGIPFKGHVVPVCECGAYGNPKEECRCSVADLKKYARNVLPMLKTAAIVMEVVEPNAREQARGSKGNEPEAAMVARVLAARKAAPPSDTLPADAEDLLRMAISEVKASRDKAVAVAATVARLEGSTFIQANHLAEAVQYQHRHLANWTDDFEDAVA